MVRIDTEIHFPECPKQTTIQVGEDATEDEVMAALTDVVMNMIDIKYHVED